VTPDLDAAYAEPHRRYHDRRHIQRCLTLLDAVANLTDGERRVLGWALWWHDAVYDPAAEDNEVRSAEMARSALREEGASLHEREEVARLIRLTAGHEVEAEDRLGALIVSIDLSILGAPPAEYDEYARGVRAEYAEASDAMWRAGRTQVLQRFLATPVIFPDPDFRARFEATARDNLVRELASLSQER
jgi:predicted metal-dependent HD superfamily phosphohydrolase